MDGKEYEACRKDALLLKEVLMLMIDHTGRCTECGYAFTTHSLFHHPNCPVGRIIANSELNVWPRMVERRMR